MRFFLPVKTDTSLCCKKEKDVWQEEADIQKEEYMDCLLIERMTGFNLAMALYEGNLPLIEGNSKECEELISGIIRNILKIHSPILRILVVDIVYGYIGQAFAMKIIKTGKAALEEINNCIKNYAGDVALGYELGKEALSEEIENYYYPDDDEINNNYEDNEELEPALSFSKFSLLRKIEKGDGLCEADLDEDTKDELKEYPKYKGLNLFDDKIGKIVTRSKYRFFPQEIEKKIQESNILTELKNAKKDDYRYKFFAFIMKNIVSKNIIISEENK